MTKCNLCNAKVVLKSNATIYGKEYGSGKCYICTKCGAFVGTHKNSKQNKPLGILANAEMRELRKKCHLIFDSYWKNSEERKLQYKRLSEEMNIKPHHCHFSWFDLERLNKALGILKGWQL